MDYLTNTNIWVHDGEVERSAVDIVELAESVAGYSAGAQAAEQAASGYADAASASVASIGTAATDAVAAVQSAGDAQTSAVNGAGGTQRGLLDAAGSAWIETLTSSGGIVTSAVGDAGTAQILAVTSAGGEQISLVSAAGGSAIGDLAAVTAAQSAVLVSTGGYQAGLVASAGTATIALVQAEGSTQTAAISASVASQVSTATSAAISAGSAAIIATTTATAASGYMASAGGYATSAGSAASAASGYMASAGGYTSTASGYAITASGYMTSAGGYATDASGYADNASGYADNASAYADGIASAAAQITSNTVSIGALQTKTDVTNKEVSNIQELLKGNLYAEDVDSSTAYAKIVPAGALPWASLEQMGGRTIVWNQLNVDDNTFTKWATVASYTLSSQTEYMEVTALAATNTYVYVSNNNNPTPLIAGHKYLVSVDIETSSDKVRVTLGFGSSGTQSYDQVVTPNVRTKVAGIVEPVNGNNNAYAFYPFYNTPAVNDKAKLYSYAFYDLTRMFGAGNEPATPEQFSAMFPADYYDYEPGTLLNTGVTSVVSKDADAVTLDTYAIPAEVQALTGYGINAGGAYNYIDFDRKVFVQNVAFVDLRTLEWVKNTSRPATNGTRFDYNIQDKSGKLGDGWITSYPRSIQVASQEAIDSAAADTFCYSYRNQESGYKQVSFVSATATTKAQVQAQLNGYGLIYQLLTPVETDISAYLTDDNLIQVDAGGSLTFPNQHGDDYLIPVPSQETYDIDLQASL